MKVLLVNGSPHKDGCTNRTLSDTGRTGVYKFRTLIDKRGVNICPKF